MNNKTIIVSCCMGALVMTMMGCKKTASENSLALLGLAGGYKQTAKIVDTNTGLAAPHASDYDGQQVSISGDGGTIAMGSWFSDKYGYSNSGTILVYRPVDRVWTQIAESSGGGNSMSQGSVALSDDGNIFVQGAWGYSSGKGAAFIQTWSTDHFVFTGIGGGAVDGDNYGGYVAISGNGLVAAVGAAGESSCRGAVHIYMNDGGWAWVQTITCLLYTSEAETVDL